MYSNEDQTLWRSTMEDDTYSAMRNGLLVGIQ